MKLGFDITTNSTLNIRVKTQEGSKIFTCSYCQSLFDLETSCKCGANRPESAAVKNKKVEDETVVYCGCKIRQRHSGPFYVYSKCDNHQDFTDTQVFDLIH